MNRPKKEFIPTSLSDLNIDSISLGSNSDRHNNNSNGATLNNLNRSKATSSFNLASHQSSYNSSVSSFSRTSKTYGSQSNLNHMSGSQSVNNFHVKSPNLSTPDRAPWEQAWEDNNNACRPPSYQQQQQREHSYEKSNKHSHQALRSNSINQATSNRSQNLYVADPFDDPWSGILPSAILLFCTIAPTQAHVSSSSLLCEN